MYVFDGKAYQQNHNQGTINNADTINNYYKDVPISSPLYKFKSWIADKTEGFVGREYVFSEIADFINNQPNGYRND